MFDGSVRRLAVFGPSRLRSMGVRLFRRRVNNGRVSVQSVLRGT